MNHRWTQPSSLLFAVPGMDTDAEHERIPAFSLIHCCTVESVSRIARPSYMLMLKRRERRAPDCSGAKEDVEK